MTAPTATVREVMTLWMIWPNGNVGARREAFRRLHRVPAGKVRRVGITKDEAERLAKRASRATGMQFTASECDFLDAFELGRRP